MSITIIYCFSSLILPAAAIYVFIRYRDSPTDGERVAALFSISLFFPFSKS